MKDAFSMIGRIFGEFRIGDILNREMAVSLGLEMGNIIVLSIALCILFLSDFLKDKGRIYKNMAVAGCSPVDCSLYSDVWYFDFRLLWAGV